MRTLIRQNRDARIDFFRGIALWSMFIDHLIKSWLRAVTLKEFAFCDSAELFVLLSGISAGIVYKRALARDGLFAAWIKILRRVVVIYRTHLMVFMLFVAEAIALVAWLHPPLFLQLINLETFADNPYQKILDAVLLGYQPKFFDILPLYIVLLLIFCVALPLIRWPRVVLSLSVLLYVATRTFHLGMPGSQGAWFFNPLAWQIIFILGAVSGSILTAKTYWRGWDWLAALFALFSFFESHAGQLANHVPAAILIHFDVDKSSLHPLRILAILSLAWLVWRYLPATASWLQSRLAEPFILLGQHSLPVFSASILFAMFGQAVLFNDSGWLAQLLVPGLGSLALLGVGALAAWNNKPPVSGVRVIGVREPEPERVVVVA
jgi:hypothetical protein